MRTRASLLVLWLLPLLALRSDAERLYRDDFRDDELEVESLVDLYPHEEANFEYQDYFSGADSYWSTTDVDFPADYAEGSYGDLGDGFYPEEGVDSLDNFFWSDHLHAFEGDSSDAFEHYEKLTMPSEVEIAEEDDDALSSRALAVPVAFRVPIRTMTSWFKETELHRGYWPVEVTLTEEGQERMALQHPVAPELPWWEEKARSAVRSRNGWPYLRLVATERIPADITILALPLSHVIHASDLAKKAGGPYEGASDLAVLAAWLLRERSDPGSPWREMLELMPISVPVPMLWSEEQLSKLDFAPAIDMARGMAAEVERIFQLCDKQSIGHASLEEFKAAMSVIWARHIEAYKTQDISLLGQPGRQQTPATEGLEHFLVPLGDLASWSFQPVASWQIFPHNGVDILALAADTAIEQGASIVVPFDAVDSTQLLMHVGKVPENNPHDRFVVFGPTNQLVEYFLDNFISRSELETAELVLRRNSTKASPQGAGRGRVPTRQVIRGLFKDRAGRTAEAAAANAFPQGESQPLYFGPNGYIDPRLLAAYATCYHFRRHLAEIYETQLNTWVLADLARDLAEATHDDRVLSCDSLMSHSTTKFTVTPMEELKAVVQALKVATFAVKQLAQVWIDSFSTTIQEDEQSLIQAWQCSSTGQEGERSTCGSTPMSEEEELALRFRLNRKILLQDVIDRLSKICPEDSEDVL